jgi:hypothetical protein
MNESLPPRSELDLFDQVLSYSDRLPLSWRPDLPSLEPVDQERLAEANLKVLQMVGQLEESPAIGDDPSPQDIEIGRLHRKLDMLLEAVGALARRDTPLPAAVSVRLSWYGVAWCPGEDVPEPDALGQIVLYLHPAILQPLRWPARILRVNRTVAWARFVPGSEPAQLALERHVFLHHRRAIAGRKQGWKRP